MSNKLEDGFEKGQSDNLPKVDSFMVFEFLNNHLKFTSAEIRGWKLQRSVRETYGNDAIGYVQVQRTGNICVVKARITPEHRVKNKGYSCTMKCDEKDQIIIGIECQDCVAQKGGCKHSVAFLMWLHRRSEEPSLTEKKCYWTKPKLATVGTNLKFIKAKDIGVKDGKDKNVNESSDVKSEQFFDSVALKIKTDGIKNQLANYVAQNDSKSASLHFLINAYKKEGYDINSAENFLDYCAKKQTPGKCQKIEQETLSQAQCPFWHELRYCRITASRVHDAAHCKTPDGSLVEQLFGASIRESPAMRRGKLLEPDVRAQIAKLRKLVIENGGLFLKSDWPILGASPDGLTLEYVIEIKCPMTIKGKDSFVKNNCLTKKSKGQIQLQMFFCNKKKGLFCIADINFEVNRRVEIFEEEFDEIFCTDLLEKATSFWKQSVFPKLSKT